MLNMCFRDRVAATASGSVIGNDTLGSCWRDRLSWECDGEVQDLLVSLANILASASAGHF